MNAVDLDNKNILVTGAAGFIGAALVRKLLEETSGAQIVGFDNLNDYYDPRLKESRLNLLKEISRSSRSSWRFIRGSIADKEALTELFDEFPFSIVVNLSAQAGVRYGLINPDAYVESNLVGFCNILEACRKRCEKGDGTFEHLIYASSSSVYGGNKKTPFSVGDRVDEPVSLYAATKKSNELLAHAYAKLFNIPTTGLRFFTVYGPFGRPDMFYYSAALNLIHGESIQIYNYGKCLRDFTYIDDVTESLARVMRGAPERAIGDDGLPTAPARIYNIGGGRPENLLDFIATLQEELVRAGALPQDYDFDAHQTFVPMQPGDVPLTFADSSPLEKDFGYTPHVDIKEGLRRFVEWFVSYHHDAHGNLTQA